MLSVAKLTPGQEGYYERSVAAGLDDYYAGRGESPGRLDRPRRRASSGSKGVVEEGELGSADPRRPPAHRRGAAPAHPTGAADHGRADRPADRRARRRGEDARAGRRLRPRLLRPEERQPAARARRRGDAPGRQRGAHAAWQAALAYLEDEACVSAAGAGGVDREHAAASSPPPTSTAQPRAQDPHLHTHVIVANMAQRRATASGARSTARRS